ncbi:uncharacterized protein LOC142337056 [Convolutriloba macropyga]|uniref:uncharacterized protein LOC142337056 n=1 Tax=Convolutriloba macropyga TaxID=536237 RepID=UPI003F52253D
MAKAGILVLAVIGSSVLLTFTILLVVWCCLKRKRHDSVTSANNSEQMRRSAAKDVMGAYSKNFPDVEVGGEKGQLVNPSTEDLQPKPEKSPKKKKKKNKNPSGSNNSKESSEQLAGLDKSGHQSPEPGPSGTQEVQAEITKDAKQEGYKL